MTRVQEALRAGYDVLKATNNSVDAVEAAIKVMELDEAFNAGYGSVLTSTGEVEMDAILIRGSDLKAGAVGAMRKNPIRLSFTFGPFSNLNCIEPH
ncbi:Isoaspartyl peptidase/L-asparaginase [Orchesella cincta]|uniref:Isoaspartyl peptidase/L-asparaginase n=1 Tax=Orchesella cincta TaxID=48709 RepID=A0A1D2MDR5_ORCCI|nr:Isoaspartyl peptidase/L-asparaginase [Orchesella cincta]